MTLSCEAYGYATFSSPPVWTSDNGANLTDTDTSKYNMSVSSGLNSLISADGSVKPSVVSSLMINQVSIQDVGAYTCSVEGASSAVTSVVTQLSITGGTAPTTFGDVTTDEATTTEIIIAGM